MSTAVASDPKVAAAGGAAAPPAAASSKTLPSPPEKENTNTQEHLQKAAPQQQQAAEPSDDKKNNKTAPEDDKSADKKADGGNKDGASQLLAIADQYLPAEVLQRLSFSAVYGAAIGVCAKKWSRDMLYGFGAGCIFLQGLSYYGLISINWRTIQQKWTKVADLDGDGKVDANDAKVAGKWLLSFILRGVTDIAGFAAGFYGGWKYF